MWSRKQYGPGSRSNRDTGSIIMKYFANEWPHIRLDDSPMDIH